MYSETIYQVTLAVFNFCVGLFEGVAFGGAQMHVTGTEVAMVTKGA